MKQRIISNAQVFDWEITAEDMRKLDSLECYGITCIDPSLSSWTIAKSRLGSYHLEVNINQIGVHSG